jgi:CcmD family protein
MTYLYAAYAATWIIHVVYLGSLVMRYKRLREEMSEPTNAKAVAGRRS